MDNSGWGTILVSGGLLMAVIGFFVGKTKGNGCWGLGLGCILGPIGILISMLIPKNSG